MARLLAALWVVWAVACGASPQLALPTLSDEPVEVTTAIDGKVTARGGRFVLMVEHDADLAIEGPVLGQSRLEVEPDGEPRAERIGDRIILTQRYVFTGAKGSHVIPAAVVTWEGAGGERTASSQPLYVDLGVDAPRPAELADIPDPEAERPLPWLWIAAGLGVVALMAAGLAVAFRSDEEQALAAVPPEAPDVVALRAWQAVRDSELSDFDKALAISRIFREYAEQVLAFKATALTTTEILARLRRLHLLEEGNLPRAKRLLRATDRIKFAEVAAGADLFDELDSDLRAFVASTRPHHWEAEPAEQRVVRVRRGPAWGWWLLALNRLMSFLAFGSGAAALFTLVRVQGTASALPLRWFMATLVFVSLTLLVGGAHTALANESTARRLRWLQLALTVPYLLAFPVGSAYALCVWGILFGTSAGRRFYEEAA